MKTVIANFDDQLASELEAIKVYRGIKSINETLRLCVRAEFNAIQKEKNAK